MSRVLSRGSLELTGGTRLHLSLGFRYSCPGIGLLGASVTGLGCSRPLGGLVLLLRPDLLLLCLHFRPFRFFQSGQSLGLGTVTSMAGQLTKG